ncbi:urease accessory protein UreD [Frankia sp. AgB32]|uniref:urease accessory protein UreD n=1 Tax=Frankia sp. AgB32 TaxID=631119 RepID=UPI00200C4846|nr:urease accessory protein UreD [Frankia sp. AgB32]MCK9893397.1 urease accessory protein UreD [Frankia sp. AgB32]
MMTGATSTEPTSTNPLGPDPLGPDPLNTGTIRAGAGSPRTGRTAVRAHAAVRVDLGPSGVPRVAELRSEVPLVLRLTGPVDDDGRPGAGASQGLPAPVLPALWVHLVGAAAGPLAGDELRLDISVGTGVRLVVRSAAATVALPGRGPGPSRLTVTAVVDDGAELDLGPEQTVVAAGADHQLVTDVRLAATARLRLREEILLGRFGEPPGSFHGILRVDVAAGAGDPVPLLRQELLLGESEPGLRGPAQLGLARAVGSLLVAGPEWAGPTPTAGVAAGAGLLPLAGPGYLVSALADDAVALRRRLTLPPGDTGWQRARRPDDHTPVSSWNAAGDRPAHR